MAATMVKYNPKFNVRRSEPVFVPPETPTPYEVKRFSDLDNEESIQVLVPSVTIFAPNPAMFGKDPAKIIKKAIAKALVFYYPLAGRVRIWPESKPKLVVECTGEGAVFIEADADITISELGFESSKLLLHPPYSFLDDIIYQVPGLSNIFDSPIMNFQVTRFKCGGFILGMRYNNIAMDGTGIAQFFTALGELARGATHPFTLPVWDRDRLFARRPPRQTCNNLAFEDYTQLRDPIKHKTYRVFYFTPREITILKALVPPHLKTCTSFELLTGFMWRSRTVALQLPADEEVRIVFAVNVRNKFNPPLPKGFYGNGFAFAAAMTSAGELCENFVGYAVELVEKAKKEVTEEYTRSLIDGLAIRGWPRVPAMLSSFFVSDLRRMGYIDVDFGWGLPLSSGPGVAWYEPYPEIETYYIHCKNDKGDAITVVPICLPETDMKLFEEEIYSAFNIRGINPFASSTSLIKSSL